MQDKEEVPAPEAVPEAEVVVQSPDQAVPATGALVLRVLLALALHPNPHVFKRFEANHWRSGAVIIALILGCSRNCFTQLSRFCNLLRTPS